MRNLHQNIHRLDTYCGLVAMMFLPLACFGEDLEAGVQFNKDVQAAADKVLSLQKRYTPLAADPESVQDLGEIERLLGKMDELAQVYRAKQDSATKSKLEDLASDIQGIGARIGDRVSDMSSLKVSLEKAREELKVVRERGKDLALNKTSQELLNTIARFDASPSEVTAKKPPEKSGGSGRNEVESRYIKLIAELRVAQKKLVNMNRRIPLLETDSQQLNFQAKASEAASKRAREKYDSMTATDYNSKVQHARAYIEWNRGQRTAFKTSGRADLLARLAANLKDSIKNQQEKIKRIEKEYYVEEKSSAQFRRILALAEGKPDPEPPPKQELTDWERSQKLAREADIASRCDAINQQLAWVEWLKTEIPKIRSWVMTTDQAHKTACTQMDAASLAKDTASDKVPPLTKDAIKAIQDTYKSCWAKEVETGTVANTAISRLDNAEDDLIRFQDDLELMIATRDIMVAIEPEFQVIVTQKTQKIVPSKPTLTWSFDLPSQTGPATKAGTTVKPESPTKPEPATKPERATTKISPPAGEQPAANQAKKVILVSGEILEAIRVIDFGDTYGIKTKSGIKSVSKADVKEIQDAK